MDISEKLLLCSPQSRLYYEKKYLIYNKIGLDTSLLFSNDLYNYTGNIFTIINYKPVLMEFNKNKISQIYNKEIINYNESVILFSFNGVCIDSIDDMIFDYTLKEFINSLIFLDTIVTKERLTQQIVDNIRLYFCEISGYYSNNWISGVKK